MKAKKVLKSVSYKGKSINLIEDGFGQQFVIIDNGEKLFSSFADAKRYINGKPVVIEII